MTEPTYPTKIDRAGLVEIFDALAAIKNSFSNVMHKFTAAGMRTQMKSVVEPILEMKTDVEKERPNEYFEARDQLLREYAAKDPDGRPIISAGNYVIDPEKRGNFETAAVALKDKHQEAIDKYNDKIEEVNEFLRGDTDFPVLTMRLKLSWFNDQTDQDHLEALIPFIENDLDEAGMTKANKEKADAKNKVKAEKAEKAEKAK